MRSKRLPADVNEIGASGQMAESKGALVNALLTKKTDTAMVPVLVRPRLARLHGMNRRKPMTFRIHH